MKSLVVIWLLAAAVAFWALTIAIGNGDDGSAVFDGTLLIIDLGCAGWQLRKVLSGGY